MITNITDYAQKQGADKRVLDQHNAQQAELARLGTQVVAENNAAARQNQLDKAYNVGKEHGAQTVHELYTGLHQQGAMQDPMNHGGGITNDEMARARSVFGDKVNIQDIKLMRRLDTLDTSNKPNY